MADKPDGYVWRAPGGPQGWTFRQSLEGRTYPEGAEFMPVLFMRFPAPIPRRPALEDMVADHG